MNEFHHSKAKLTDNPNFIRVLEVYLTSSGQDYKGNKGKMRALVDQNDR